MNGFVDECCDFYGCVICGFIYVVFDIFVLLRFWFVVFVEEGIYDVVEFSCGDIELRL